MDDIAVCELCGHPMAPGEEMFKFHGYSGPCPEEPSEEHLKAVAEKRFSEWLNEGHELAKAAGCGVIINVSPSSDAEGGAA
ncbi:hypothetical protein [Rhizobium aethiopicum]|uniref:Uncharacterized protein n=1 Tax=Rhizobium aethiopicum TaxID=1138170 RepID=A0A7W6Q998_9HYPH|nr:hypothetical protein [Rhizobium aethiopicum]MBB4192829.1 hypothetical protein [Rhizobium aethiopicum]